jgi:ABC-2 type transport system ATP-binding protein
MVTPAIRTEGLGKRYGKVDALADLSLQIAPGEVVGYLGPNGAGKTTTIRLLLGLARPTAGRAEIFGLDCQRQTVEAHRRRGQTRHASVADHGRGHRALHRGHRHLAMGRQ